MLLPGGSTPLSQNDAENEPPFYPLNSFAMGIFYATATLSLLLMMYHACITPGSQPRIVKQILMRKSAPHPALRTTATGGRKMARK